MASHYTVFVLSILALWSGITQCQNSRSVSRSGASGSVNLVEFNARGVIYGRCSYNDNGQFIEVMYEDTDGEILAKASNPTVLDAVAKTHECRDASTRNPDQQPQFRSIIESQEESQESSRALALRLLQFQRGLMTNQRYVSELSPRFFGFSSASNKDYMITLGSSNTDTINKPEFAFSLPHKANSNQETISFGSPFSNLFEAFGKR